MSYAVLCASAGCVLQINLQCKQCCQTIISLVACCYFIYSALHIFIFIKDIPLFRIPEVANLKVVLQRNDNPSILCSHPLLQCFQNQ